MQRDRNALIGVLAILGIATAVGLASNALRSDGLPVIRKPLRETRAVVRKEQLMAHAPVRLPSTESDVSRTSSTFASKSSPVSLVHDREPQQKQSKSVKPETAVVPAISTAPQTAKKATEGRKPEAQKPSAEINKIQALFTNLNDAKACFDNKSAVFMDARASEDYEAEHITGALLLYFESVEDDYDKVLGDIPKDQLLITYCSDQQCASAIKLADALVARGHTRVVIMLEGLPGWKDAGYPTATGKEAGG